MKYETSNWYRFPKRKYISPRLWSIDRDECVAISDGHQETFIHKDMIIAIANQLLDVAEYKEEDYTNEDCD